MEGKATFTLTEARTGRTVKQLTEHNMITDAAQRILNPPLYAIMNKFNYSDFIQGILPLSQSVFGGIILLGNTLEESKSNIMFDQNCIPIATAGGAYSGTNVMRGSLNQNETYATANGYHFTWDFGTDKANGTIKCAALTSRKFGNTGFTTEDSNSSLIMNPVSLSSTTAPTTQYFNAEGQYLGTFSKLTHTYFKVSTSDNTITFMQYRSLDPDSVGVNDSQSLSVLAPAVSATTVTLPIRYSETSRWFLNTQTKTLYFCSYNYLDGEQYKVDYAGISMTDFTVTETGNFGLPYRIGNQWATVVFDGKLFMAHDNTIDIFSSSGTLLSSYPISITTAAIFFMFNGMLYFVSGNNIMLCYIDGKFYPTNNLHSHTFAYSSDILPPYYPSVYNYAAVCYSGLSSNPHLVLAANFFSTINNLSEPIEKTNEHALKITYDITN